MDTYKIREDFPILKRRVKGNLLVYFDNASTTQKPRQVIDAIRDFYENHNANVHRSTYTLSKEATDLYEKLREQISKFINSKYPKQIVFVRGTTEAINLVAYSWGLNNLNRDDEMLISLMEHHRNIVPWEIIAKLKGFKINYPNIKINGSLDYEDLENKITTKTKIICLSHVSNVTSVINDIKRITKVAHDKGP